MLKANDKGRVCDLYVADALASISLECHENTPDGSVGPNSIVIWRRRPGVKHLPGSAHQSYAGLNRDREMPGVPSVANGLDVGAIFDVITELFSAQRSKADFDPAAALSALPDELNRRLADQPEWPDDRLR